MNEAIETYKLTHSMLKMFTRVFNRFIFNVEVHLFYVATATAADAE